MNSRASNNSILTLSMELLSKIQSCLPVLSSDITVEDVMKYMPLLTAHSVENIALLSLTDYREGMSRFYRTAFNAQLDVLRSSAARAIRKHGAIFIQGFTRNTDFEPVLPASLRQDVDIFIPRSKAKAFTDDLVEAGYGHYGFTEDKIIEIDHEMRNAFTSQFWAEKDFTLTKVTETSLPDGLPIKIDDVYLPYIIRSGTVYLYTSIEPHYSYIGPDDNVFIQEGRQYWPTLNCDRLDETTTLYFNILRLSRGVPIGEYRLRLVLETACLVKGVGGRRPDLGRLQDLIERGSDPVGVRSTCAALTDIHSVFEPVSSTDRSRVSDDFVKEWTNAYVTSLSLDSVQ